MSRVTLSVCHDRFGVDRPVRRAHWAEPPPSLALETLRRLGEDVVGRLG